MIIEEENIEDMFGNIGHMLGQPAQPYGTKIQLYSTGKRLESGR